MKGRIFSFAVTASAIEVAKRNPQRRRITFTYATVNGGTGDAANVLDGVDRDATAGIGMPVGISPLVFEGEVATHRFSAIRLVARDGVIGVLEEFDEGSPDDVFVTKETS